MPQLAPIAIGEFGSPKQTGHAHAGCATASSRVTTAKTMRESCRAMLCLNLIQPELSGLLNEFDEIHRQKTRNHKCPEHGH